MNDDPRSDLDPRGFSGGLAVFSGPSGSGKTSICKALLQDPRLTLSVSATTRPPRTGEQDGVDYHFFTREDFQARIDGGEFVEWAQVYDRFYGTLRQPLVEASAWTDRVMLLDIDVQGARQLRDQEIQGIFVFVAPPSMEELRRRLTARATDSADVIERRLEFAASEMASQHLYDHVLVNVDLDETIERARLLLGLNPAAE